MRACVPWVDGGVPCLPPRRPPGSEWTCVSDSVHGCTRVHAHRPATAPRRRPGGGRPDHQITNHRDRSLLSGAHLLHSSRHLSLERAWDSRAPWERVTARGGGAAGRSASRVTLSRTDDPLALSS